MDKEEKLSERQSYAGFGIRFLAYAIDSLIIFAITIVFSLSLSSVFQSPLRSFGFWPEILIGAAYYIVFWMRDGQTLGNRLLAIRVVREDNQKFDFATGIILYIGYVISSILLWLGFLWIIWDPKKQGLHDKIAKTVVVRTGEKSHIGIAIAIICFSSLMLLLGFAYIIPFSPFGQ